MNQTIVRRIGIGAVSLALVATLGACGSDSKKTTTASSSSAGSPAAYCDGIAQFPQNAPQTDETSPVEEVRAAFEKFATDEKAVIAELTKSAPSEAKADVAGLLAYIETARTTGKDDSAVGIEKYAGVVSNSTTGCGWSESKATAVDFEFKDAPTKLASGTYAIALTNSGKEPHVLSVAKVADGVTKSVDDLLAEGSDAGPGPDLKDVGAEFAAPGGAGSGVFDLKAAGRYVYYCPIPGADGQPHFMKGMKGEFTVN